MLQNLLHGLTVLGNGPAIAYLVAGSLAGMFFGVVPGLGGAVILTMILAFINHIDITGTLCLFLATQAGSYFSASISSILLNTPAHPEAFAVTFDGFPMAQRGEAGRALGISATSTCIGGFIGCAVLVGFIQIINDLPSLFHPPEYVALITIALLLVGTLGTDAVSKAVISMGLALMISTIGTDPITGSYRFTFGAVGLLGGISIVGLFLGLFAIPQMVLVFGTASTIARQNMMGEEVTNSTPVELSRDFGRQAMGGVAEALHHWGALVRSALIGVVTGIIPGIGGFAANFMSYGIAQQLSRTPERFGTGIPEGIIAPEGSSLSKEAGGMIPVLGLGIPGGIGGAIFLAALTIKGIRVGYGFTTSYPTLAYETVWIIALGGLVGTAAGLLAAPWLARVTRVPGPALVPFIMAISVVGTFVADVSFFSVMEVLVFALIGFALRRLRFSLAAFGIGLVLGPTLESNIYLTHTLFPGFSFLKRPFADTLFVLAIALLIAKALQLRRASIKATASLMASEDETEPGELRNIEAERARIMYRHPYPLLGLIVTSALVAVGAWFVVYTVTHYNFTNALMPVIGGSLVGIVALWRLPLEITGYLRYRRNVAELRTHLSSEPQAQEHVQEAERAAQITEIAARTLVGVMPSGVELIRKTSPNSAPYPPDGAVGDRPLQSAPYPPDGAVGDRPLQVESAAVPLNEDPTVRVTKLLAIRDKTWGRNGQYSREVAAFGWLAGLILGCYLLGFNVGVPAFCVAYGLSCTGRFLGTWAKRATFAGLSALATGVLTYEMQHLLHIVFSPVLHF